MEDRNKDDGILIKLATMDERSKNMEDMMKTMLSTNIDMAKRIATLELWKEGIMGKSTIIAVIIGAGWTLAIKKFF